MRIAISSDLCLSMTNGVAVFARTLAEGLAKNGHEVLVLCPSPTLKAYQKNEYFNRTGKISAQEYKDFQEKTAKTAENANFAKNLPENTENCPKIAQKTAKNREKRQKIVKISQNSPQNVEVSEKAPKETQKSPKNQCGKITYSYLSSVRLPVYPDQIHQIPKQRELWGRKIPRLAYKNGLLWSPWPGRQVKKALDKFRPDVIHNQTAETVAFAVLGYARKRNIPLVSTGHAYPDNITSQLALINTRPLFWAKKSLDQVLKWWMNSFLKHSEYATMPTQLAIDDLLPKNRRRFAAPVEALSNGTNLDDFHPGRVPKAVRERYRLPAGAPTVLYVGRLDGEKSVDKVVEAFALAQPKAPEARLVVVGDGIAKADLEAQASDLGLTGHAYFLGKVTAPDIYDLYRTGDVFVTASETETQGIVLIEAAATGLPLVAVDKGAVSELCQNGKNGYLCEAGNIEQIASAIVKILRNPKLRAKFAENSLEIASHHDFNKTLARFVQIYKIAIGLKAGKST